MKVSGDSSSSEASEQQADTPDTETAESSESSQQPTEEAPPIDLAWSLLRWDVFLAGAAFFLMVIIASTPVRNSDVWLHLAAGRDLVQGQYSFGSEPYSYTSAGNTWVNHAWLFDVVSYALFANLGEATIVGLKVVLGLLLLAVVLQTAQTRNNLAWLALTAAPAALLFLWLFFDVRELGWWSLAKVGLIVVWLYIATNPMNWTSEPEKWIAGTTAILAIAGGVWLVVDIGVGGIWLCVKLLVFVGLMQCWRHQYPEENTVWWSAVAAAGLVLALIPWLSYGPVLVSLLFLALTWWLLERDARQEPDDKAGPLWQRSPRRYWPLILLFWLWVNFDEWFLLGPFLVVLYLLGQGIALTKAKKDWASLYPLGVALLAGVAVCVLNPHHIFAFRLPAQLLWLWHGDLVSQDPLFFWLRQKPWDTTFLLSAAGLSWWLLVVFGSLSFVANLPRWSWPRLVVFVVFLGLSCLQGLFLPFFAVLACPILAVNFADLARHRRQPLDELKGLRRGWIIALRPLASIALMLLLVLAWPGLLQGRVLGVPYWAVEHDPYLVQAAEQVQAWREDGVLAEATHGINVSPGTANYFAYYNPKEKNFVDARLHTNANAVRDYLKVRQALFGPLPDSPTAAIQVINGIRPIMRKWQANHLIVQAQNLYFLDRAFFRLYPFRKEWPLIHLQGRTAIFGWRDPDRATTMKTAFQAQQIDLEKQVAIAETTKQQPSAWRYPFEWDIFVKKIRPPSAKQAEAALYQSAFERLLPGQIQKQQFAFGGYQTASVVGQMTQGAAGGPFAANILTLRMGYAGETNKAFRWSLDEAPLPYLHLTLRAARQAVRDNPRDANAYWRLGRAYYMLGQHTRERLWALQSSPKLGHIRTIQMIAALKQALRFDPNLGGAHKILAQTYLAMQFWDLALEHQKQYVALLRRAGKNTGGEESLTRSLTEQVKGLEAEYNTLSAQLKLVDKIALAGRQGLAGKALELLLQGSAGLLSEREIMEEIHLLLRTGKIVEVHLWVTPGYEEKLGGGAYHWLKAQEAAAHGNFPRAEKHLKKMVSQGSDYLGVDPPRRQLVGTAVEHFAKMMMVPVRPHFLKCDWLRIADPKSRKTIALPAVIPFKNYQQGMAGNVLALLETAESATLQGVLALEDGRVGDAEQYFRDALSLWSKDGKSRAASLDFPGRRVAEGYLQMIEAARK